MCGRYVVLATVEELTQRFQVTIPFDWQPNYNVGPGTLAPVIASDDPHKAVLMQFGLTPFWAKKRMYFFNARAEGDHNPANDPAYHGARGIISKPAFRKAIREQRCLVIADAFIEGTTSEKLDKPYLVHLGSKGRPFAFAGIWDEWIDTSSGEILRSFAIITTTANKLLQQLPHHRSPVILQPEDEKKWLNTELPLAEATALLHSYESEHMNAYPISKAVKNPRANDRSLLHPEGPDLLPSSALQIKRELRLEGMGWTRARSRG